MASAREHLTSAKLRPGQTLMEILSLTHHLLRSGKISSIPEMCGSSLYETSFFDGSKQYQLPTKRIRETYTGDYNLWVSFTFRLRSNAELEALGFENLPVRSPLNKTASARVDATETSKADDSTEPAVEGDTSQDALLMSGKEDKQPANPVARLQKPGSNKILKKFVTSAGRSTIANAADGSCSPLQLIKLI